jgi:hypothetical protein
MQRTVSVATRKWFACLLTSGSDSRPRTVGDTTFELQRCNGDVSSTTVHIKKPKYLFNKIISHFFMFYMKYLLFADVLGGNDLYSQDRETPSQEVKRLALAEFEADVSTMTIYLQTYIARAERLLARR